MVNRIQTSARIEYTTFSSTEFCGRLLEARRLGFTVLEGMMVTNVPVAPSLRSGAVLN
jgi:hypothetical protein